MLCYVTIFSCRCAEDKFDPAEEIQKQFDQGIAKGEQMAKDLVNAEVEKRVKSVGARVEEEIKGKLPESGNNIIYIVLAIMAIVVVLSIVKKLIKLAVIIIVLGLLIMWAKPMLLQFF